jgi:hypothetical protein
VPAVDTSVLVRSLLGDDPVKLQAATLLIDGDEEI